MLNTASCAVVGSCRACRLLMLYVRAVPLTAAASRTSNFLVKTAKGARFVNECANPQCTGMLNSGGSDLQRIVESVDRVNSTLASRPVWQGQERYKGAGMGIVVRLSRIRQNFQQAGAKGPLLVHSTEFWRNTRVHKPVTKMPLGVRCAQCVSAGVDNGFGSAVGPRYTRP